MEFDKVIAFIAVLRVPASVSEILSGAEHVSI
jgi:hypothetical protein